MSQKTKVRKYQRHQPVLDKLSALSSFTLSEAKRVGLSHPVLLNLVKHGKVLRLSRGIYVVTGSVILGKEGDFSVAFKKFKGRVVISGLTALSHYGLVDEVPSTIWLLAPSDLRTKDKRYRLLRTNKDLSIGVLDKKTYRIASIERALLDGVLFSSKIGVKVCQLAIIRALRDKLTTPQKIFQVAEPLGALSLLDRIWQSVLAGVSR
jgi:predicted transcriptional regulator of viral defense system